MMEMLIEGLTTHLIEIIVLVLVTLITLAINRALKVINELFSLEIAEFEIYQVARNIYDIYDENEELDILFSDILETVNARLDKKGVKINQDELTEIIDNVMKDLKAG